MKKLIVILLCVMVLAGCANAVQKACKELTKAHEFMVEAEVVAKAGHEKDPNIVTADQLIQLEMMRGTIGYIRNLSCTFGDSEMFDKQIGYEKDPNIITEDQLIQIEMMRETITFWPSSTIRLHTEPILYF